MAAIGWAPSPPSSFRPLRAHRRPEPMAARFATALRIEPDRADRICVELGIRRLTPLCAGAGILVPRSGLPRGQPGGAEIPRGRRAHAGKYRCDRRTQLGLSRLGPLHRLVAWIDGCVGVTNAERAALSAGVDPRSPIEIRPRSDPLDAGGVELGEGCGDRLRPNAQSGGDL